MKDDFDVEGAKKYLNERDKAAQKKDEEERKAILQKTISILEKEFRGSEVEVYLVGSILRPFSFSSRSDVDIVLKNFKGDRFDLWPKLEEKIGREIEVILFERCSFQEFVLKEGFKVV
jgi:predicted nucleotidyltransferase